MSKHTVRLATVMALLLVFSQIASAASPFIPVKSKPMKSYGVFLPAAVELDDKELAEIEGEGLVAGVLGAVAGAVTGAISYTVGYVWDVYIDDALANFFGEGGTDEDDPVWEWSSFYDSAGKGVITGFLGGLIMP
ncbi:MAG TPA: hypothetical protein GXZ82_14815 [Firmicutes bacterium]|jgi:hypothetical protein|nr:hypothetical protein [Bacillota bacterium]